MAGVWPASKSGSLKREGFELEECKAERDALEAESSMAG